MKCAGAKKRKSIEGEDSVDSEDIEAVEYLNGKIQPNKEKMFTEKPK